jgi:hypothetical protein
MTAARTQVERQAEARELLARAGGRLELAPDGRVRVADPELARRLLPLRAEVREPLAETTRVPAEGVGWVHRACSGYPRKATRR